jgi:flagellar motor switch protein FliN/FliY
MLDAVQPISLVDLFATSRTPQLRSALMESLSERIMRQIRLALFERMRNSVQIAKCTSVVTTLEAAIAGAPETMFAAVVQMSPMNAQMIVIIDARLIAAVVDGMCGASQSGQFKRQELSPMETRIGKQLIDLTLHTVAEAWRLLTPLTLKPVQYETATGMLAIADDKDWMIVTQGKLDTATGAGTITVICPHAILDSLESRVTQQSGLLGTRTVDVTWENTLDSLTEAVPVELSFDIARAPVAIGLVESLAPGQMLPCLLLDQAIGVVRGVDLLTADFGQANGRICCRPRHSDRDDNHMVRNDDATLPDNVALEPLHALPAGGAALVNKGLVERVPVTLTVELGRTTMAVKDLRQLRHGQIVVLDQTVGEPLGIYANGHRIAFGEVVSVAKDQYGIRVTTLAEAGEPRKDAAE